VPDALAPAGEAAAQETGAPPAGAQAAAAEAGQAAAPAGATPRAGEAPVVPTGPHAEEALPAAPEALPAGLDTPVPAGEPAAQETGAPPPGAQAGTAEAAAAAEQSADAEPAADTAAEAAAPPAPEQEMLVLVSTPGHTEGGAISLPLSRTSMDKLADTTPEVLLFPACQVKNSGPQDPALQAFQRTLEIEMPENFGELEDPPEGDESAAEEDSPSRVQPGVTLFSPRTPNHGSQWRAALLRLDAAKKFKSCGKH